MNELWNVLFERGLARKKGINNVIDRKKITECTVNDGLTNFLECSVADKQLVIRIGVCSVEMVPSNFATM
jgi:hypothetical protein